MPKEKSETEYIDDFEVPQNWEQLRDEDGHVMDGSFRTLPSVESDDV